jgi:hypothetical protein
MEYSLVTRARNEYLCHLAAYNPNHRQPVFNDPSIQRSNLTSSSVDSFWPFLALEVPSSSPTRAGTTQKDFPTEIPKAEFQNNEATAEKLEIVGRSFQTRACTDEAKCRSRYMHIHILDTSEKENKHRSQ